MIINMGEAISELLKAEPNLQSVVDFLRLQLSPSTQLSDEVTTFLENKGVERGVQQLAYRLEIAYRLGYIDALTNYAIWKDGEQLVGAMATPLKTLINQFANKDVPVRY